LATARAMRDFSLALDVYLKDACPLRCKYCYLRRHPHALTDSNRNLSPSVLARWIADASISKVYINVRYGEPALSARGLYSLIQRLRLYGVDVLSANVVTSAFPYSPVFPLLSTLLTTRLQISVDGPYHVNRFRVQSPKLHSRIEENIRKYLAHMRDSKISAAVTVTDLNLNRLQDVRQYLEGLGFPRAMFSPVDDGVSFVLSGRYGDYLLQSAELFADVFSRWERGESTFQAPIMAGLNSLLYGNYSEPEICNPIRRTSVFVAPDGRVFPCIHAYLLYLLDPDNYSSFLLGSIHLDSFEDVFDRFADAADLIREFRYMEVERFSEYGILLGCEFALHDFAQLHNVSTDYIYQRASPQVEKVRPAVLDLLSTFSKDELLRFGWQY